MIRLLPALLLVACSGGVPQGDTDGPFVEGDPTIDGVAWACNPDDARWSFEVSTTAWTGGGSVWIGKSADDVEKHDIGSDKAAADGTWDCLTLDLDQVADWRDASNGSSSRWRCSDLPLLTFVVQVTDPHGTVWADCRTWGADPTLSLTDDSIPDCSTIATFESSGDTADTGEPVTAAGSAAACDG